MQGFRAVFMVALVSALSFSSWGQQYPEADYDPEIPTLQAVVGHEIGADISTVQEMADYFDALAEAAPDRMAVRSYGESWQGRPLQYAVVSSAENMARLDDILERLAVIGAGDADEDTVAETPAVVWLSYGVHGDEITPSDSAVFMAYHLLAAQNNELVDTILENTIVLIDPSQNPDGRARFVHSFTSALGSTPQGDRYAAEHDQPWPRGRFNHYVFDLNRDWFALTQPETQGKVAALIEWQPVVFVDSHEMGGDATYYFPPAARPFNPNIIEDQKAKQVELGQNMAAYFDAYGVPYFTREIFDAFYPGYGDMWPTLNGTIAMTFEQGSPRGLIFDRRDGTRLTYSEGVRNNVLSSLATLEIVARNKDTYLGDYADFRRSAIAEARDADDRYVVMDLGIRRHQAEALGLRLAAQGIAVQRTPPGSRHCGDAYPSGALLVDLAQPQGRLARTLLSRETPLDEAYIEEQESRRARGLNHELYDTTAWSMPLMDGVAFEQCTQVALGSAEAIAAGGAIPSITSNGGRFGQIVPWSDAGQAQLVVAALQAGFVGKTTDKPFVQGGRTFPSGSVVFPVAENPDGLAASLRRLAREIGAEVVPMDSSWVDEGPNWGSSAFAALKMPRVAMAWGEGTSPTSAGNTRFVLERQLGIPVAPIRVATLRRADLDLYDVVILPDTGAGFSDLIGSAQPLQDYVSEGGVLIGLAGSVGALASEDMALLSTSAELVAGEDGQDGPSDNDAAGAGLIFETEDDYAAHIRNAEARPEDVPGVLVRAEADTDHWLSAGYTSATALVTGRDIYTPLNAGDGYNVFRFAGPDDLVESGYLWEENRAQLAFKPFVMAEPRGDGLVIAFTQSPTTRGYLNGLNLLLANAVVLAPARISQ